jgi:bifunctional non-homologous end joining protein LigD
MKCIKPMLARLGTKADLEREGYLFEPKLDGIRATFALDSGRHKMFNRSCRDVSARYPEFDFADAVAADRCVLDGEIVLYDQNGNPNFTALMKRHLGTGGIRTRDRAIRFAAFDVLRKDGEDLTGLPLVKRKEILRAMLGKHPHLECIVFTRDSKKLWEFIQARSLEGVIAKREDSRYEEGQRSSNWLKVKAFDTIDAVIVGFTSDKRAISSLALAVYDEDVLRFIGKVGTGMSMRDVKGLREMLEPDLTEGPPVASPAGYRDIQWVNPKYVAEVRYLEFGTQGMLRNPSFMRLRTDKTPEECQLETQKP